MRPKQKIKTKQRSIITNQNLCLTKKKSLWEGWIALLIERIYYVIHLYTILTLSQRFLFLTGRCFYYTNFLINMTFAFIIFSLRVKKNFLNRNKIKETYLSGFCLPNQLQSASRNRWKMNSYVYYNGQRKRLFL